MIKSRVIDIIKYFSAEELKQFSVFVESPFFNNRTILTELLDIYRKNHPGFDDEKFTKENVYRLIYPGKKYNDELFRNLNSDLSRLAEEYLSIHHFYNNRLNPKINLLSELNIRKIFFPFERRFEDADKFLNLSESRDKDYYYDKYILMSLKETHCRLNHKSSGDELRESEINFLKYFFISLLEMKRYNLYLRKYSDAENLFNLESEIIYDLLKKFPKEITDLPQIKILYCALKLEETFKSVYYTELKSLLHKHGNLLDKERLYNIYFDMLIYIIKTRSPTDIRTTQELFEIRFKIIEKNLFTDSNFIPYIFFISHVKSAIRLKKIEWIKKFLLEYKNHIDPVYKESTINYCLALLNFYMKNFDEALKNLAEVKYDTVYFNLELKLLTSKIYFELKNFDMLFPYMDSYKRYIFKSKAIEENQAKAHLTFINILNKLTKIYELRKYHKLEKIEKEISKIDDLYVIWLLEKTAQLKKLYYES